MKARRAIQQAPHPYFYRTLTRIEGDLQAAGDRVLDAIAKRIE